MVDLLHPQEITAVSNPPASVPLPIAPPPTPPAILQSQFTTPPVQAPSPAPILPPIPRPVQIGSTQMPGLAKSSSRKKPLIIAIIALILLVIIGAVVFVLMRKAPTPVIQMTKVAVKAGEITNIAQASTDGVLAPGAVSKQATVAFSFDFGTTATSGIVIPEVEVQPINTHFTDQPNITGKTATASGSTLHLTAQSDTLKDGSYHWQALMRVGSDNGPWKAYELNPFSFGIATGALAAPAVPVVDSVGGVKVVEGKVTATSTKPVFYGTAPIGSVVTLVIKPAAATYKATTDNSGAWTITPTADIPSGDHTVSITAKPTSGASTSSEIIVSIAPVVTEATPTPKVIPDPAATPSPTPSATPAPVLAPTGDPIVPIMTSALLILILSLCGLYRLALHNDR